MALGGVLGPDLVARDAAALCVAGVALGPSIFVLRGRRRTWRHLPWFCVAGVALMALGWLWWRAWAGLVAGDAAALCVAGVANGDILLRFTWQAWRLVTSTFVLRGRRGTYGTAWRAWTAWSPVTPRHFAWQAWHLVTSTFVLRDRRGACRHPPSLCVAGVALMALRGALGRLGRRWRRGTLRGRRGTYGTGLALVSHTIFVTHHLSHTTLSHTFFHTPSLTHPLSRLFHTSLSHAIFHTPSFTPNFVTRHLWHTIFHTPLCHPSSLTHNLSHTTLSHTILDPQLCHTPSFTHHFVTHHLWHTIVHTPLCHTPSLTLNFVRRRLSRTAKVTPSFTQLCHNHLWPSTLSHTIFHTPSLTYPLSHTIVVQHHFWRTFVTHHFVTPSFTHHFVTRHLWHTIFDTPSFTPLCHTPHTIFYTQLFHTPSLTHHLSHTTLSHTPSFIFHTQLCRTPTLSHAPFHTQLSHTPSFTYNLVTHNFMFYFSILHHLLCLSFFPRPRYNIWCSLLEKLPCGVIRSFYFPGNSIFFTIPWRGNIETWRKSLTVLLGKLTHAWNRLLSGQWLGTQRTWGEWSADVCGLRVFVDTWSFWLKSWCRSEVVLRSFGSRENWLNNDPWSLEYTIIIQSESQTLVWIPRNG